ncbi:MAG TPA: hypothetical protein PLY87_28105, partial [Planctomycetaceae bacterium]|nr:hypothetical protein [Planctomycetaceae bacterium]HQZ68995.1 hypothetical protein [Planctomycetaceae bacterium]
RPVGPENRTPSPADLTLIHRAILGEKARDHRVKPGEDCVSFAERTTTICGFHSSLLSSIMQTDTRDFQECSIVIVGVGLIGGGMDRRSKRSHLSAGEIR